LVADGRLPSEYPHFSIHSSLTLPPHTQGTAPLAITADNTAREERTRESRRPAAAHLTAAYHSA